MDLNTLKPEFRSRVDHTLEECARRGVEMRPYFALRTPVEQAKLWRQSRSSEEIQDAIDGLRQLGAHWIADVLDRVGPQYGNWATNALPGESWHQYGEAVDCVWIFEGKSEWSTSKYGDKNGYRIYAQVAEEHGLTSLGPSIADWAHIQLQPHGRPTYDWEEIDQLMKESFG